MNSKAGTFEYNKVKLLNCIQSFFSITPTKYYHDFNRYLEEIRPDYVNTEEAERLFLNLKGCIKFYAENVEIQNSIQQEIDELPFSPYNCRLLEDLLFYLDNKSLKVYYRIFELEKRISILEDQLEFHNRFNGKRHHYSKDDVFEE